MDGRGSRLPREMFSSPTGAFTLKGRTEREVIPRKEGVADISVRAATSALVDAALPSRERAS
jgi:hypothetical protein